MLERAKLIDGVKRRGYKVLRKVPGTAALGGKNDPDYHVIIMKTK